MPITSNPAWIFVRGYGRMWDIGILSDHVAEAVSYGAVEEVVDGAHVIRIDGEVVPVVCGEIIEIATEDGPATGRCGLPVVTGSEGEAYACEGHTQERESWRSMSEMEKAYWEREQERF